MRQLKKIMSVLLLAASAVVITPAAAQDCDPTTVAPTRAVDAQRGTPAPFGWEGEFIEIQVCYLSRQSGAELAGYLFAPPDIDSRADLLPVVVIGPGSGTGRAYNYLWSARELAAHGYLALVGDPQGVGSSEIIEPASCGAEGCPGVPYQQTFNYVDGLQSATDFVFTRAHPWLAKADLARVGLAGHSLSARAASYVQGIDERIQAVVAWDNLTSDLYGDAGISSGGGTCGSIIGGELPSSLLVTARVPAMGQASDAIGTCSPTNSDPDIKKTAYHYWRDGAVPSMQLVFAGSAHGDWAQTSSSVAEEVQVFQRYTRAWFDRYLKGDARSAAPQFPADLLGPLAPEQFSTAFRSAYYLPDAGLECADIVAGCAAAAPAPGSNGGEMATEHGRYGGALPSLVTLILAFIGSLRRRRG